MTLYTRFQAPACDCNGSDRLIDAYRKGKADARRYHGLQTFVLMALSALSGALVWQALAGIWGAVR